MVPAAAENPRLERALLAAIALATLALHLACARGYGFFRDEFYYLACGRHLAWGYVDHPPLIALLAAFSERVLGGSIVAIRLLPALAHAALVFVAGLTAQRMRGGRYAQVLAALAVLIAPVYLASAGTLNMNPFDQLLWTLVLFAFVDAFANDRAPNAVAVGVLAGLGLMNKHSLAFSLAAALVGLAISPQRTWLRTRGPWVAGAIAAAIAAPNLVWEVRAGWPTLEFLRHAAAHKNYSGTPAEFLAAQFLIIHPIDFLLALGGVAWLVARPAAARFRAIGWGFVAVFVLMFVMKAKHYYLAPAYPAVLAAGAVAFERFTSRGGGWRLRPTLAAAMLMSGAALAPLTLPILAPATLVAYTRALGVREPQSERHRPARLSQQYADMFGWEEMAAEVGRVYRALPATERSRCVIFASNYGEAGALEWFGPKYGLPKVASGHNNYFLWGPPDTTADVVITVGEDSLDVAKSLRTVERAGTFRHEWNMPYESDLPIYVGRGLRLSWREIWRESKEYI